MVTCRQQVPPPQALGAQTYTAYGCRDNYCLCSGDGVYATCRSGYTEGTRTYDYTATTTCHIMGGYSLPSTNTPSDVECIPNPAPPPCGDGVCAFDETAANCPQDCLRTTYQTATTCATGYTWNHAQGRCLAQCGGIGTAGTSCADLQAPAIAGNYCSRGFSNQLAEPGYCCPTGQYYEVGTGCVGTQECTTPTDLTTYCGPSATNFFYNWLNQVAGWVTQRDTFIGRPLCVGPDAIGLKPAGMSACHNVTGKFGEQTYYDWTDINGNPAGVVVY